MARGWMSGLLIGLGLSETATCFGHDAFVSPSFGLRPLKFASAPPRHWDQRAADSDTSSVKEPPTS